jgi:hypothetical protein
MAIFSIALNIKLIHHVCSTYLLHSCVIVDNTILQGLGPNVNLSAKMPVLNILLFFTVFEILAAAVSFFVLIFILQFFFGEKAWENCGFSV